MNYLLLLFLFTNVFAAEVAITIDDFNFDQNDYLESSKRDQLIRSTLKKNHVLAMGFVTTKFMANEKAILALKNWEAEGHPIGNHTENHFNYHKVSFDDFSKDLLIADKKLSVFNNYQKFFRFPYLKEGDNERKRDGMRTFLKEKGFQNGAVTIDASDWYVNLRLLNAHKAGRKIDIEKYRSFYLSHIWERSEYYQALSKKTLGRDVKYTLLLHHNATTALFLDDLIKMYKEKGWRVISPLEAFADPIYKTEVDISPAGESLIWSIAKLKGDKTLRYPAESDIYEEKKMDQLEL